MKKTQKSIKTTLGLIHIALPLILIGCTSDESDTESDPKNEEVINESDSETIEETNSNSDKPNLAGTCPRGLHCAAPGQCGLFTDENANDLCDRGE